MRRQLLNTGATDVIEIAVGAVTVARDYKKPNVLRFFSRTGAEFLLQFKDVQDMATWLHHFDSCSSALNTKILPLQSVTN